MGGFFSKHCSECNAVLVYQSQKNKSFNNLEWNVTQYKCKKCGKLEELYQPILPTSLY